MNLNLFLENLEKKLLKISISEGEELQPKEKNAVLGYSGMTASRVMQIPFLYLRFKHEYTPSLPSYFQANNLHFWYYKLTMLSIWHLGSEKHNLAFIFTYFVYNKILSR